MGVEGDQNMRAKGPLGGGKKLEKKKNNCQLEVGGEWQPLNCE